VTSFLLNAPPGEFMDVVTDVRGLLSDESVLNESAPNTFREYNTDQMLSVDSPGQAHKAIVCKDGELQPGEYLDPRAKQVVLYDHIRQTVTGARAASGAELIAAVEPHRAALDAQVQTYVQDHYKDGAGAVFGKQNGSQTVLAVCISSAKFNARNFWNGRWRSRWEATFSGQGEVSLAGVVRLNVHYYEDGNVQLVSNTPIAIKCPGGDPKKASTEIINAIKKAESSFSAELDRMYAAMGETTFKALRRALPITRSKIDWEKIRTFKSVVAGK